MFSKFLVGTAVLVSTLFFVESSTLGKTEAEYLEAIEAGNSLIKAHPDDFRGYASRGCGYEYLKKFDLAEQDILKALTLSPRTAGLYNHLATIYFETGRYEQAANASLKSIELGNRSIESYKACLANLTASKQSKECLTLSEEVIRKFPNDGDSYYFRAISKIDLDMGTRQEILSDFKKATTLSPNDLQIRKEYDLFKRGKSKKYSPFK